MTFFWGSAAIEKGVTLPITSRTFNTSRALGVAAYRAGFRFRENGQLQQNRGFGDTSTYIDVTGEWMDPLDEEPGSNFEVYYGLYSSTTTVLGDSVNTWLSLSSDREWYISTVSFNQDMEGDVLLRRAAVPAITISSAYFTSTITA